MSLASRFHEFKAAITFEFRKLVKYFVADMLVVLMIVIASISGSLSSTAEGVGLIHITVLDEHKLIMIDVHLEHLLASLVYFVTTKVFNSVSWMAYSIPFAFNIAREIRNKEIMTYLSCPVRRSTLITSKLLCNYLLLYAIVTLAVLLDAALLWHVVPLQAYLTLVLVIGLQLLLPCLLSFSLSVFCRNEVATLMGVLTVGVISIWLCESFPNAKYVVGITIYEYIFQYLSGYPVLDESELASLERLMALSLAYHFVMPLILAIAALIYFIRRMSFD